MREVFFVRMSYVVISIFVLFATGCATSDVVKINDEYRILKEGGTMLSGNFRLASLKADALSEANDICNKEGKEVVILDEVSVPVQIGVFARYELTFKCSE
jgi:ATP:corrinoid adenosyltransferase